MGAWISFMYKSDLGKSVGHTTFINKPADLQEILDRYYLQPNLIWDIKINDHEVAVETIVRRMSS